MLALIIASTVTMVMADDESVEKTASTEYVENKTASGDLNSDGELDIVDVVLARAIIIGSKAFTIDEQLKADMNGDGFIDIVDVVIMRQIIINGSSAIVVDLDTDTETDAKTDTETDTDTDANANANATVYENEVIRLVNEIRTQYGLNELKTNLELSRIARLKSQDMVDNNYFSHISPTYGNPFTMIENFGISYRSAAENIANGYATPQAVVNGWMNSSGHRGNILNSSYTQIGVGYVANGNYWTQIFIG